MIALDLETELDDRGLATHQLTVCSVYDLARSRISQYNTSTIWDLVAQLPAADCVIGYNILAFDFVVLNQYAARPLQETVTAFDLYRNLCLAAARNDITLDELALGTLGHALPQHGEDLAALGQLAQLKTNSANGVYELAQIYRFGYVNRYVSVVNKHTQQPYDVQVDWNIPI